MKYRYDSVLVTLCFSLLLGASFMGANASADETVPALPIWQSLEFEQKAFWATAQSRIEINQDASNHKQWQLTATSSVASNFEQVEMNFNAQSGYLCHRTRESRGKGRRYKSYDYREDSILRERREPGTTPEQPASQWPLSNSQKLPYPELAQGMIITDAYALLLLAERLQAGSEDATEVVVHTDYNFYRVSITRSAGIPIDVDYQITGADRAAGERQTRGVTLQATPLGTLAEKPDFSLLGLHGRITLLFDTVSGLPVQLRGTAPKLGATEINLKSSTLRSAGT